MRILQQPDTISFCGNLVDFIIGDLVDDLYFKLSEGDNLIIDEVYSPEAGKVRIQCKDVIDELLSVEMPSASTDVFVQANAVKTFKVTIGTTILNLTVVKGGFTNASETSAVFLKTQWLTLQPQQKTITVHQPEYLSYYGIVAGVVKVKAYYADGSEEKNIASIEIGKLYSINVSYLTVSEKFAKPIGAYDVWVEDLDGNRLTYMQRYLLSAENVETNIYVFENTLGGIDTVAFTGKFTEKVSTEGTITTVLEESNDTNIDFNFSCEQNTGFIPSIDYARWLRGFFVSKRRYHVKGFFQQIYLKETEVDFKTNSLNDFAFEFFYSKETKYDIVTRNGYDLPYLLEFPEVDSLPFLAPRLAEFPIAVLADDLMLPAQHAHESKWRRISVASILGKAVGDAIGNIDLSKYWSKSEIEVVKQYLMVFGEKIKAAFADDSRLFDGHAWKDWFDQAVRSFDNVKFRSICTENFVRSMIAGMGAGVDERGNMQVESLEVRSYMKVIELIYNRLNAIEGDQTFTDFGTIDTIDDLGNNTYRLGLRKRWDTDFTSMQLDDVLYGCVNNLLKTGEYYFSWFRVIARNTMDNTLTVVLYPDSEVPAGKNFPPSTGMNITRRGNSKIPTDGSHNNRQDSWTLSSTDGAILFLQNVYKPVLEQYNYALAIGRLPKLDIFKNLPIGKDDMAIYAKHGIFENLWQIDYNGDVSVKEVNRGSWSLETAQGGKPYRCVVNEVETPNGKKTNVLEVHTVYHLGCKWQCLLDKTELEPRWNSTGWKFLEGDDNYTVDFHSPKGWNFFLGSVNVDITAIVRFGNIDITGDVMALTGVDVQWRRNSGDVPLDNAWNPDVLETKNKIHLVDDDMGPNWIETRFTEFICTFIIPIGGETRKVEGKTGFKI